MTPADGQLSIGDRFGRLEEEVREMRVVVGEIRDLVACWRGGLRFAAWALPALSGIIAAIVSLAMRR